MTKRIIVLCSTVWVASFCLSISASGVQLLSESEQKEIFGAGHQDCTKTMNLPDSACPDFDNLDEDGDGDVDCSIQGGNQYPSVATCGRLSMWTGIYVVRATRKVEWKVCKNVSYSSECKQTQGDTDTPKNCVSCEGRVCVAQLNKTTQLYECKTADWSWFKRFGGKTANCCDGQGLEF